MSDHFEQFTDRARKVLTLAQEESQRFNHNYIGTEHLLLGLIREEDGVAARVLNKLGAELLKVRDALEQAVGRGKRAAQGQISLTPRAKRVIQLAVDEARNLNHHYIGTEHLLLALISESEGTAVNILQNFGLSLENMREQVIEVLSRSLYNGPPPEGGINEPNLEQNEPANNDKPPLEILARQILHNPMTARDTLLAVLTALQEEKKKAMFSQRPRDAARLAYLEDQLKERIKQMDWLEGDVANAIDPRNQQLKENLSGKLQENPITAKRHISPSLTGLSLVEQARKGELDPLVSRENESERLLRILNRRYNPHALLVGGDGVGKSAIVHGLATQIASTEPPPGLASTDVIWLDLNDFIKFVLDPDMVANLAGDETHSVILFVPHFDQLLEFAIKENRLAVLYYVFSHLGVRLIATTTPQGYERIKQLESTIAYRFQVIQVSEPDEKITLEILRGLKARYEQHYGVTVEDSALEIAQYLSQKYFPDRTQPSKALDLLDEACSLVSSRRRPEPIEAKDEKLGAFENLVTDYNVTEAVSEMTGKSIPDIRKELFS